MSSVKVDVKPEIIEWVLERVPENSLGEKLSENVDKWRAGEKKPTFHQLEDFSRKSHIPLGYFFLDSLPEEKIDLLKYRTVESRRCETPSRNLVDTIYAMQDVQDWMSDYRKEDGFEKVSVVGSMKGVGDAREIAARMRCDLKLSVDWFRDCANSRESFSRIREILESYGIVVMVNGVVGSDTHRPLDVEEFRAFAMVDDWAPLIFINGADSDGARLFSLLHEAAHIWIGEDDLYDSSLAATDERSLERICNAVASEILVPEQIFRDMWPCGDIIPAERVQSLANYFRCSSSVIARRALDAGEIDRPEYTEIVQGSIEKYKEGRKKSSGGNYYNNLLFRLDRGLVRALNECVGEGRITYSEACRLTNTNYKSFMKVTQMMEGV